jgi:hypothetical protein
MNRECPGDHVNPVLTFGRLLDSSPEAASAKNQCSSLKMKFQ